MKRKYLAKIGLVLFSAMLFFYRPLSAAADSRVTYEGSAKNFVFLPEDKDLFDSFKGVMPGDFREQEIELINSKESGKPVNIYLKAGEISNSEFLEQLQLNVSADSSTIFQASAAAQTGLEDWKLLGTLAAGASVKLTAKLTVPVTLDNQFMDNLGEMEWLFKVEEIDTPIEPTPIPTTSPIPTATPTATPIPTTSPAPTITPVPTISPTPTTTPAPTATAVPTVAPTATPKPGGIAKTGDTFPLMIFAVLSILSLSGLVVLLVVQRSKKRKL